MSAREWDARTGTGKGKRHTVTNTVGGAVGENPFLVEVRESICLCGEGCWDGLQECCVVYRLDVDEVEDLDVETRIRMSSAELTQSRPYLH